MTKVSRRSGSAALALLPLFLGAPLKADDLEVTYQPPASGVQVTVSAPDPTSTPIVFHILLDGQLSTAAVLASGWYRYKAIVADGVRNPKIAKNPKATPLPSETEFLVPADKSVVLIAQSHGELVGSSIRTCTIPFTFVPRAGFRYVARWKVTPEGCLFGVAESALEPADAPETPLTSLPNPGAK